MEGFDCNWGFGVPFGTFIPLPGTGITGKEAEVQKPSEDVPARDTSVHSHGFTPDPFKSTADTETSPIATPIFQTTQMNHFNALSFPYNWSLGSPMTNAPNPPQSRPVGGVSHGQQTNALGRRKSVLTEHPQSGREHQPKEIWKAQMRDLASKGDEGAKAVLEDLRDKKCAKQKTKRTEWKAKAAAGDEEAIAREDRIRQGNKASGRKARARAGPKT